jgi:hypothetical protein
LQIRAIGASVNGTGGGMMSFQFNAYLYQNSDLFKNAKDNNLPLVVKLFACNTGKIEGPGGLAYEMSKLNPQMQFWAPTTYLWIGGNSIRLQETGNPEYINVYQNGKIIERRKFSK